MARTPLERASHDIGEGALVYIEVLDRRSGLSRLTRAEGDTGGVVLPGEEDEDMTQPENPGGGRFTGDRARAAQGRYQDAGGPQPSGDRLAAAQGRVAGAQGRYQDWQGGRGEDPQADRRAAARGKAEEWYGSREDPRFTGDRARGAQGRYQDWQAGRPSDEDAGYGDGGRRANVQNRYADYQAGGGRQRRPWDKIKEQWPPSEDDPTWGVDAPLEHPDHPLHVPGEPSNALPGEQPVRGHLPAIGDHEPPADMPPGTIWPPLPEDAPAGKHIFLVWISGVGLRYGSFEIPQPEGDPNQDLPEGEAGGRPTRPGTQPVRSSERGQQAAAAGQAAVAARQPAAPAPQPLSGQPNRPQR
jgi:hypothetical protein